MHSAVQSIRVCLPQRLFHQNGIAPAASQASGFSSSHTRPCARGSDAVTPSLCPPPRRYPALLADRDPVPLAAVGVLRVVVERNGAFFAVVQRLGLLPRLLALLDPTAGAGRSRQALLLARALVESADVDLPCLHGLGLARRVADVLIRAVADAAADLYEPALDLAASVLQRAVAALRDADASAASSPPAAGDGAGDGAGDADAEAVLAAHEPLLEAAPAIARLCALDLTRPGRPPAPAQACGEMPSGLVPADAQVVEGASLCLLLLAHLYPAHVLLPLPDVDGASADGQLPSPAACVAAGLLAGSVTARKRLLKAALTVAGGAADPDAVLAALYEICPAVEELAASIGAPDEAVAELAAQTLASIQALAGGSGVGEDEYRSDGFEEDA